MATSALSPGSKQAKKPKKADWIMSFEGSSSSGLGSSGLIPATTTATTATNRCWDEEYPRRQLLLRRSTSDRRSAWTKNQRCAVEMRFGMTTIARMSKDRREEEEEEDAEQRRRRRRCAEEEELEIPNGGGSMVKPRSCSPALSSACSCSNEDGASSISGSIFSTNPHSSSFSSSVSSAKDETAAAAAEAEKLGSHAFLDFNLVGGDLVAAHQDSVDDRGGGEQEQQDGGCGTSSDSSDDDGEQGGLDDDEFAPARASSSSSSSSSSLASFSHQVSEHIHGNIQRSGGGGGVHWHLLRSYKEIVGGERCQVARKLLRGCSPVGFYASPARLFVSGRPPPPPPPSRELVPAEKPSLRSKIAKATTETHDIYCRPSYKSQRRRGLPSFFRRRSSEQDGSQPDLAVATLRQAHLHCSLLGQHHSQRSYTFVVEGSDELLVARPSSDSGFGFSFFSWKHRKPRLSRERSWRPASWSSSNKESEKVASMVRRGDGEMVLLDRRTPTPSAPRASFGFTSWDPACSTSWCPSPGRAKKRKPQSHCSSPTHSAGGGGDGGGDMELLRHVWGDAAGDGDADDGEEIAAFVVGSGEMTAILPAGRHSLPSSSPSSPSPLVHRWRSGGSCDCGGWDLGCGLNVLHHRPRKSSKDQEFKVALEVPGKQAEAVCIKALNNGLVSVTFQEPLVSAVQAFAAAVAAIAAASSTSLGFPEPAKPLSSASMLNAAAAGAPPHCFERL